MKRDEIKEAALKLFAHKGYAGCSMQEIADHVGLNKATLYFYFHSKDELFIQILEDESRSFLDLVNGMLPLSKDQPIEYYFYALTKRFVFDSSIEKILFWKKSYLLCLSMQANEALSSAKKIFMQTNEQIFLKFGQLIRHTAPGTSEDTVSFFTMSYFVFLQGLLDLMIAAACDKNAVNFDKTFDMLWHRFWNGNKL